MDKYEKLFVIKFSTNGKKTRVGIDKSDKISTEVMLELMRQLIKQYEGRKK